MSTKTFLTIALVAIGFAAGTVTVQAADNFEPATKTVSYDDLNMDSDKGAEVFYGRVTTAAHEVCSSLERRELAYIEAWKSCVNNAVGTAVKQVNNSKVTALYNKSDKSLQSVKLASLR